MRFTDPAEIDLTKAVADVGSAEVIIAFVGRMPLGKRSRDVSLESGEISAEIRARGT